MGIGMDKKIKCVRCHGYKVVPINWQYRECKPCHLRTNRRRMKGKESLQKIEQKAIGTLLNFESAWKNYKKFTRQWKGKPKSKEEFRAEWLKQQEDKIQGLKKIIEKYNDSRCPILTYQCLEFRRLFSVRLNYINTEDFSESLNKEQWELFYNHLSCPNCNQYQILHKYDAPIEPKLSEEVSEKEFNDLITEFFEATKPHTDKLEAWENRRGLKEIPKELMKHLSSEYAQQDQQNHDQ
jgi:hypothetical protein